MKMSKQIEIPLSKIKLTLMFFASIVFFGTGIAMMIHPEKVNGSVFFQNPTINFIFGIVGTLFGGIVAIFAFKKLNDNSPGLIISDEGVVDNSGGISAGFIPWTDITAIKETKVFTNRMINVVVKNPEDYIARQKNVFKRKAVQANYSSFGTVISISANGLKSNQSDLKAILDNKFAAFNNKRS